MNVILTGNVLNLGRTGDEVRVADGYARNFLFPRSLAIRATSNQAKQLAHQKRLIQRKADSERLDARHVADKLKGCSFVFERKVGEDDRLFGSVSSRDVVALLLGDGYQVDRRSVGMEGPFKRLGIYSVDVRLHASVTTQIKVWVVAQQ